jgi:prepilin-type N-terminal cleavage/methylation domain-containing protein
MKKTGFTLMELAISVTIFGILTLVAAGIINIGIESYDLFLTRATFAREAQNTLRIMLEKIPLAIPSDIKKAQGRRLQFITIKEQEVEFQYVQKDSILRYRVIGEQDWRVILNNIAKKGFEFNYYESDGKKTGKGEDVRLVEATINLEKDDQSANYTYKFFIRNK